MKSFAPTIIVDGKTVTPAGWMWLWAFALRGCEWAIKIVDTEKWKTGVKLWFAEREAYFLKEAMDEQLKQLEKNREAFKKQEVEIEELKKELHL